MEISKGRLWVEDSEIANDGEYSITLEDGCVVDGAGREYEGTLGRNLNHAFFSNAKVECDGEIVIMTDVKEGEEITIDYGPHYRYVGFEWIDIDWEKAKSMDPCDFFRTNDEEVARRRYMKLISALGCMGQREKRILCDTKWIEYNKR